MDDLAKARSENEELRSIITEKEKEIQHLHSQLNREQRPQQSDQEWIESFLAERAISHPDLRPFEWTMELVTFALKAFSDYVWENYLSDSQKAELKLVGIYDYEQLYDYGWKHYADYNFPPRRFKTGSALRIFWEGMTKERGFRQLKDARDSLLEFPRPSYEWTSGPIVLYPWVKHTASVPSLTKEAFERYLRNQIDKPSPEEIMSSTEWYWTARQEKLDHGQHS